ncbi:metacaspase-3-like [Juglans microcarpa x Juglans regia]|uniref:metacaspase-3-like n=1 Tax=Juglans microcarpa x Juglans regia TaxID=2249226 RepID=UPI001B7E4871|nr:metacaspase-3-like [Juglans microcarpa x Juglans regia]
MPVISNDQVLINKQQSSSTTITSTTHAASRPSTDSSSQDIKRPSPAEAPAAGGKRALLCGVTCRGAGGNISRLEGPVNDVKEIKKLLIKHFGYTEECIRVLTDQEENKNKSTIPTKENIEGSLKWLVKDAESGHSLVFFFSGHGRLLRQPESCHVCLVDCTGEGMIPNSYINSTIVRPLKEGVTLYAIVDACHSGSILDLKYEYNQQSINAEGRWIEKKSDDNQSKADQKATNGGLAICLSACRDDVNTPESNANSSGQGMAETSMGAMTYQLIKMVSKEHPAKVTYEDILKKMHDLHVRSNIKRAPFVLIISSTGRSLLRDYQESQKIEEPVLSSSLKFQVSSKKFLL